MQSQDTRNVIARAAIRLFAHQGYDGTSLSDIVKASGVTKPVIYYYFKSKEELFITLIQEIYDLLLNALREKIERKENYVTRLQRIIRTYFKLSEEDRDALRLLYGAGFGPRRNLPSVGFQEWKMKHRELLKSFFLEGIQMGIIRQIPVEEAVFHFLGSINYYLMMQVSGEESLPENLDVRLADFLLHGIGTVHV